MCKQLFTLCAKPRLQYIRPAPASVTAANARVLDQALAIGGDRCYLIDVAGVTEEEKRVGP